MERTRGELAASFDFTRPMRVSRAPGRLDVMGGIADYTGSLVCELPIDRAAAVVTQRRDDRQLQVFSFNLFDEHQPFTLRISLDALANNSIEALRAEFDQPGRKWAGYLAGCLAILHEQALVNLRHHDIRGWNLALYSTVPLGAGVSSSAAIEVATMINFMDELGIPREGSTEVSGPTPGLTMGQECVDPLRLSSLCQMVENRVVGAPCGIMDQVASCAGHSGALLRMVCQPHELQAALMLPPGVRVVGINSNVKHSVGGGQYGKTRCAAFMGHAMLLRKMQEIGIAANRPLSGDPMRGYLANLALDDYKMMFREYVPEFLQGKDFIDRYGTTTDRATKVDPDINYHVQHATDHHVFEASRVKNFATFIEEAGRMPMGSVEQTRLLDKAGHLMYASHLSYTNDAMLGADECDLLVKLIRENERKGLFGAKITGGGSGGTVAVLCRQGQGVDAVIDEIVQQYEEQTSRKPEIIQGTSPGAWSAGTVCIP
jgi:L-arabinokinase